MTDTTWPPPFTLKPAYGDPEALDTGEGAHDDIHWSITWGFALNFNHDETTGDSKSPVTVEAHFSGADLARGFAKAEVTPDQLDRLALLLMAKAARVRQEAGR